MWQAQHACSTQAEGGACLQARDCHRLHRPQMAAPRGWAGGLCWEHHWWRAPPPLHSYCRRPAFGLSPLWTLLQHLHTGSCRVSNHVVWKAHRATQARTSVVPMMPYKSVFRCNCIRACIWARCFHQALKHTDCSALQPDASIPAIAARRGNAGHAALDLDTRVSAQLGFLSACAQQHICAVASSRIIM